MHSQSFAVSLEFFVFCNFDACLYRSLNSILVVVEYTTGGIEYLGVGSIDSGALVFLFAVVGMW